MINKKEYFHNFRAVLPLLGWSHYAPEGLKISCSIDWQDQTFNVLSFNITIFLFVFFIPALIILITNNKIIRTVTVKFKF